MGLRFQIVQRGFVVAVVFFLWACGLCRNGFFLGCRRFTDSRRFILSFGGSRRNIACRGALRAVLSTGRKLHCLRLGAASPHAGTDNDIVIVGRNRNMPESINLGHRSLLR